MTKNVKNVTDFGSYSGSFPQSLYMRGTVVVKERNAQTEDVVVTINGKVKLAVLGGFDGANELDSVELYNTQTEKWATSDFKLSKARYDFSFLTIKLGEILSIFQ